MTEQEMEVLANLISDKVILKLQEKNIIENTMIKLEDSIIKKNIRSKILTAGIGINKGQNGVE